MSYYNGPKIITNGLVLCLNAGNSKSYQSGATVWTDISRNGNNATLTNAPTFNSANGGAVVFNESYGSSTISLSSSNMTIEMAFKQNNTGQSWVDFAVLDDGTNNLLLEYGGFNGVPNTNGHLRYFGTAINEAASNALASASQYVADGRIHVLGLSVSSSAATSYFDGVLQGTASFSPTINFTRLVLANDLLRASRLCACNIYYVKLYNRGLSTSEILQNYNALKGRFI